MKSEHLTVGLRYSRYHKLGYQKPFSFGIMVGVFKGFTHDMWAKFQLSRTKECAVNPEAEDDFVVIPI